MVTRVKLNLRQLHFFNIHAQNIMQELFHQEFASERANRASECCAGREDFVSGRGN